MSVTEYMRYIWKALRQHSNVERGLRYAPSWQRWLYTFKAIICFVLDRQPKSYEDYPVVIAWTDGGSFWSEYGTAYWSECLVVGHGLRRGWWYALDQDSSL
jgi:hypothetical protein